MKKIVVALFGLGVIAGCWNQNNIVTTSSTSTNSISLSSASVMQGHDHQAMLDMANSNMNMDHTNMIESEKDFLINMIPHHQEAIDTSKIILTKTQNSEIKKLAENIILAQEKEINDMKNWIEKMYPWNTQNPIYMNMMWDLNSLTWSQAEKAYLSGMILHHQWAIDMAKKVLTLPHSQETMTLAQNILSTQNDEIETMKSLISKIK